MIILNLKLKLLMNKSEVIFNLYEFSFLMNFLIEIYNLFTTEFYILNYLELLPEWLKKAFKYIMRIEPDEKIDYEEIKSYLYDYEGSPRTKDVKTTSFTKLCAIKLSRMSSDIDLIDPETPVALNFNKSDSIIEFWIPDESCHASDITAYSSFSQHLKGMLKVIIHRYNW